MGGWLGRCKPGVRRTLSPDCLLDGTPELVTPAAGGVHPGEPLDRLVLLAARGEQVEEGRYEDHLQPSSPLHSLPGQHRNTAPCNPHSRSGRMEGPGPYVRPLLSAQTSLLCEKYTPFDRTAARHDQCANVGRWCGRHQI